MKFLLFILQLTLIFSCSKQEIDGVIIKNFNTKNEYFKEGRYHALGLEQRKKSFKVATHYLKEALKLDPTDYATIDLLGSLYRSNNQIHIEERLYKFSLSKSPGNLRLYHTLGRFYLSNNQYEKAENILEQCVSISRKAKKPFLPCYSMLATAYSYNSKIDKALRTYKNQASVLRKESSKAVRSNPGLGTLHYKIAELYFQKKDFDNALKNSTRARQLLPNNWPAYKKSHSLIAKIEEEINEKPSSKRKRQKINKKQ